MSPFPLQILTQHKRQLLRCVLIKSLLWTVMLVFVLCSTASVAAQKVSRLSPDNGLSQGVVNRLKLDDKGQLWLATESDLDSYDGTLVKSLRSQLALTSDVVWDFEFLSDDRVHLATADSGLIEFNLRTGLTTFLQNPAALPYEEAITLIRRDTSHSLWYANALTLYQLTAAGQLTTVTSFSGKDPAQHYIRDLLVLDQAVLLATSTGLYHFDRRSQTLSQIHYLPDNASEDQHNTKSLLISDGQLLVGTVRGLYSLELKSVLASPHKAQPRTVLAEHNVWHIKASANHGLLLATDAGLVSIDPKTWRSKTLFQPGNTSFGFADDTVLDFVELADGAFWLGTRGDGAYLWTDAATDFDNIYNKAQQHKLSHNFVFGLYGTEQDLWIGTQNGLNRYHWADGSIKPLLVNADPHAMASGSTIYAIYPAASAHRLWLATAESLVQFDTLTEQILPASSARQAEILHSYVYSLTQTNSRELLLFNDKGAYEVQQDNQIKTLDKLSSFVTARDQAQWFGPHPDQTDSLLFFYQGCIWSYDRAKDKINLVYALPEALKTKGLYAEGMQKTVNNSLWFLISGLGLVELDATNYAVKSTFFAKKDAALSTATLYALQQDKQGFLWMSSHSGLWRFNPKTQQVRQFTTSDGLAYNEFNSASGYFSASKNRLIFGSLRGISLFNPDQFFLHGQRRTELYVSALSLESRPLPTLLLPSKQQTVQLNHDDYGLKVQVADFQYQHQNQLSYQFDLTGPMDLPSYTKPSPVLSLPHLIPGNYQLKVRSFNLDSEQYSDAVLLSIAVAYPPWRSPLAYTMYLALILSSAALWFQSKARQRRALLRQHQALKEVKSKLELALAVASSDIWSADLQSDSLGHSNRMPFLFSNEQQRYSISDYLAKLHPDDRASYSQNWQALKDGESDEFACTYRIQTTWMEWRWFKDVAKLTANPTGIGSEVHGLYTDITTTKLTELELEQLSHYDQVTGLPNRNLLQQYLSQHNPTQFQAFIVLKLLRFNEMKHAFGDLAANSVLLQASSRLRSSISTPDLLIHAAESTFIIALQQASPAQVLSISEQLLALLNSPLMVQEHQISISCIAGTACQTKQSETPQQLLSQAEIALQLARESGGDQQASYQAGLLEQTQQKFILQQQLRDAIASRQLLNYYQPIINARTSQVVGLELLSRWSNNGQFIAPDLFIAMAEQSALIDDLTCNSLEQACIDLKVLAAQGYPLYVSVNLSASQLSSKTMIQRLEQILQASGIATSSIRLEITESTLIHNKETAIRNLDLLRQLGFKIFLDDFGTGYSSLKYIQDFPLDAIKIDRSFVADISKNNNTAIIDTIITLAHSLGVLCIAEGVETEQELKYLLSKDCSFMQGYLFSKPVPQEQLVPTLLALQTNSTDSAHRHVL